MSRGLLPDASAIVTRSSVGNPAGAAKRGCSPPTARTKSSLPAHRARERGRARDRELVHEARADEHRVDRERAGVEVHHPDGVQRQPDEIVVRRRQQRAHPRQHEEPRAGPELEDERDVDRDERRGEPGDPGNQADEVAPAPRREHGSQRLQERRRVPDRIAREEQRGERVGLEPRPERLLVERPVDADHATDALQHEAEAQGDGLEPVSRNEDEERVAGPTVRELGGDEAVGGQRDRVLEGELQHAGVHPLHRIEREKATAGEHTMCVDGQAHRQGA